jgi:hypothetical protein
MTDSGKMSVEQAEEYLKMRDHANKIGTGLDFLTRDRIVRSEGVLEGFNLGIEAAAKLVESSDEVTMLRGGKRYIEKKTSNNVNGCAYAEAIRALSREKGQ